jgi:demethylmenaquinone methyltransferase/2-methoxy-6-polyprenyl-1,4-benzoquinol methylase
MNRPIQDVKRSKQAARITYNRLSRWYDILAGGTERKYREWGLEKLSAQADEEILEIGFGTGHCLVSLARSVGPSGRVIGVDLSDGMLAMAQKRLKEEELIERVDLHLGDAANLNFLGTESLDGIFMSFTLELFDTPEIPCVLQECRRVLKPDGRLAVVFMSRPDPPGRAVRVYEWFHEHLPAYADCRPIHARQSIEENGFMVKDFRVTSIWGLPVDIILARKY